MNYAWVEVKIETFNNWLIHAFFLNLLVAFRQVSSKSLLIHVRCLIYPLLRLSIIPHLLNLFLQSKFISQFHLNDNPSIEINKHILQLLLYLPDHLWMIQSSFFHPFPWILRMFWVSAWSFWIPWPIAHFGCVYTIQVSLFFLFPFLWLICCLRDIEMTIEIKEMREFSVNYWFTVYRWLILWYVRYLLYLWDSIDFLTVHTAAFFAECGIVFLAVVTLIDVEIVVVAAFVLIFIN